MATSKKRCPLPFLTLLFAVGQLVVSALLIGEGGGHRWSFPDTPLTPAPATFAIWGVIFLGSLVYGIYQVPRREPDPALLRNTRPPMSMAFLLCCIWLGVAEGGFPTLTFPIHLALLVALALGFGEVVRRRQRHTLTPVEVLFVSWPLGLYAGWVTLACMANLASVLAIWLPASAMQSIGIPLLAGTGLTGAAAVHASRGHPTYTLALLWGLGGIVQGNLARDFPGGAAVAGGLAILVLVRWFRAR